MSEDFDPTPREVELAARKLAKIHINVRISNESSGWHIYFPSPYALQRDGAKELNSMHGSVNMDMYLGTGDFEGKPRNDNCGKCHKYDKKYRLSDLLDMLPLPMRGVPGTKDAKSRISTSKYPTTRDSKGVEVPFPAGRCQSILTLPPDHPVFEYLRYRRIDPFKLYAWTPVSFCDRELVPDDRNNRYYPYYGHGFRLTSQGRLIFHGTMEGSEVIWQGRMMDVWRGDRYYMYHPYENRYKALGRRKPDGSVFYNDEKAEFVARQMIRYWSSPGAKRGRCLMGWDTAVMYDKARQEAGLPSGYVALAEGPLDAARVGPPAVAVLGKALSSDQAGIIANRFRTVVLLKQRDKASDAFEESARRHLGRYDVTVITAPLPDTIKKDIDEADYDTARNIFRTAAGEKSL